MEVLGFVNIPGWLVVIATFLFTICVYTWYKQSYFRRHGLPSKPTTFFLGELATVMKKGFGYVDADFVKEHGQLVGCYFGNRPSLLVSDTDIIKHVTVKEFSNFTERPTLGSVSSPWQSALNLAEGDHWRFLRSTLSPSFTSGKLRYMSPYIRSCLSNLHSNFDEKISEHSEGFDVESTIRGYTMDVICSTGFGIEVNSQKDPDNSFIKMAKIILERNVFSSFGVLLHMCFPDLSFLLSFIKIQFMPKDVYDFFATATKSAFEDRKQSNTVHKDLLQLMVNAHKSEHIDEDAADSDHNLTLQEFKKRGLTDEEVLVNSIVFMLAGYDTTTTTLCWLLYDLVLNPECQDKLVEEIDREIGQGEPSYDNVFNLKYLDMLISETLRMHPPAVRLNRTAKEDIEICGIKIGKGLSIAFSPLALHYMPEYWEEPDTFNPERFAPENKCNINEYAYMPFGLGPRNCIGMRLAMLEVKMTLVSLLQKYRFFKTDKLTVPMPVQKSTIARPEKPIVLRLEKRAQDL